MLEKDKSNEACSEQNTGWCISIKMKLFNASSNTIGLLECVIMSHNDRTVLFVWLNEGKRTVTAVYDKKAYNHVNPTLIKYDNKRLFN